MIQITKDLAIDENELAFDFIRASGPGGQNVNKVSSAVQLRFDVEHSASLTEEVRSRLKRIAHKRINAEGVLIIEARQQRTQEQNRQEAVARLAGLLRTAAQKPRVRKKTNPTPESRRRRLEEKRRRAEIKRLRRPPASPES